MMEPAKAVEVKPSGTPEETAHIILNELRRDLAEWMTTDRDLVWRPALTLTKEDNEFVVRGFVPEVDAKDVEVLIAPDVLLIKGEANRGKSNHRTLLRSIKFPRPVDPNKVHAEIQDGVLSVEAEIARSKVIPFVPRAA
jgi:HSP20 family molecular chaperone IbpA